MTSISFDKFKEVVYEEVGKYGPSYNGSDLLQTMTYKIEDRKEVLPYDIVALTISPYIRMRLLIKCNLISTARATGIIGYMTGIILRDANKCSDYGLTLDDYGFSFAKNISVLNEVKSTCENMTIIESSCRTIISRLTSANASKFTGDIKGYLLEALHELGRLIWTVDYELGIDPSTDHQFVFSCILGNNVSNTDTEDPASTESKSDS